MKTTRMLGMALLAMSALTTTACDDDDEDDITGTGNTATVRFVNATGQSIDVGTGGTFASGNSNLAFGGGSQCLNVNPSSAGLTFRQNGQTSTFTPTGFNASNLQAGRTYTVVVSGTTGNYTSRTYEDTYAGATATQGGVRVISNLTSNTNYQLFVGPASTMPSAATNATFASGQSYGFFPVSAGDSRVWLTTGSGNNMTTAFTSPTFAVSGNNYTTMVVTDPATTGGAPRSFTVNACR